MIANHNWPCANGIRQIDVKVEKIMKKELTIKCKQKYLVVSKKDQPKCELYIGDVKSMQRFKCKCVLVTDSVKDVTKI